jgi:hypothetical protein
MDIDHIFIFTENKGKLADELVAFGLTEGGSRVHEGQGTANRTFVFENFFLELVCVHNEQEIKGANVLPTGLWMRANFKLNGISPFGLCIDNTVEAEALFKNAFKYRPDYFPNGMTIDILNHKDNLCLPWTCRLPFKRDRQKYSKPPAHKNGIKSLTKASFQFTAIDDTGFLDCFEKEPTIQLIQADDIWLTLSFDNAVQGLAKSFDELKLTILY